jgi:hypothetical protein
LTTAAAALVVESAAAAAALRLGVPSGDQPGLPYQSSHHARPVSSSTSGQFPQHVTVKGRLAPEPWPL